MGEALVFKIDIDKDIHIEMLHISHAQALFDLTNKNRETLQEWLPWVEHTTKIEDTQEFIRHSLTQYVKNGSIDAPVLYKGKLVGMIALLISKRYNLKRADIGYWLDSEHQGKGIISKCAQKMLEIGFEKYNLRKITIHCATDNSNSCNVAKRLGFHLDGTLRQEAKVGEKIEDLNVFSITQNEYKEIK
jgi:ribosomal-protein-serine acetyltransferase